MNKLEQIVKTLINITEDDAPCNAGINCPFYKDEKDFWCSGGENCIKGTALYIQEIIENKKNDA